MEAPRGHAQCWLGGGDTGEDFVQVGTGGVKPQTGHALARVLTQAMTQFSERIGRTSRP